MFEAAESEDQAMALKETYTTDEKGCIELKYLAPGTYCIQEVDSLICFTSWIVILHMVLKLMKIC